MPLKLSDALGKDVPLAIAFPGGTANIKFNPGKITKGFLSQLDEIEEIEFFGPVITEWDMVDDDGVVIPFTAEALEVVPIPIRRHILMSILRYTVPNPNASGS